MSRSGYNEDADYDRWQWIKWRGQVAAATRGKRGQQLLLDLIAGLDALPQKRLIRDNLILETGDVCALGAAGLRRGIVMWDMNPDEYNDEQEHADDLAVTFNVATCLIQEIEYTNDELWRRITPEERWRRMREWAISQLQPIADDPA